MVTLHASVEVCSGTNCDGYRGFQTQTRTGRTCQKWSAQSPHTHSYLSLYPNTGLGDHNYCRNPDGDGGGLWCITAEGVLPIWGYCDVWMIPV